MYELLILRHGKSDWGAGATSDHSRPLNPRGERSADLVGRFLKQSERIPDLVLSSTATRALTTAKRAALAGDWKCELRQFDELYGASIGDVLAVLASQAGSARRVLVAGHEPTSSALVQHLTGARAEFPTAGLACIGLDLDSASDTSPWSQLLNHERSRAALLWFTIPRLLENVVSQL